MIIKTKYYNNFVELLNLNISMPIKKIYKKLVLNKYCPIQSNLVPIFVVLNRAKLIQLDKNHDVPRSKTIEAYLL